MLLNHLQMVGGTRVALALTVAALSGGAGASPFTSLSPSGLNVTSVGASTVGGIVAEFEGLNGVRVVSQLAASSLYVGFASVNPFVIGSQAGYNNSVTGALGGGIAKAYFRFSLYDGDTAAGNFDQNDNTLLVNGVTVGNWSNVQAQNTDGLGNALAAGFSGGGFRNNLLDTGWFSVINAATLATIYAAIDASDTLSFSLNDVDPFDNYFDFTQGIDRSLINIGSGPVVVQVPEPGGIALIGAALAAAVVSGRRRKTAAG